MLGGRYGRRGQWLSQLQALYAWWELGPAGRVGLSHNVAASQESDRRVNGRQLVSITQALLPQGGWVQG